MKRNWRRGIIGGISFASALFIFQACYGTPQDIGMDMLIQGQVKSKSTGSPIKGIQVSTEGEAQYDFTDEQGKFDFYIPFTEQLTLRFIDVDSLENGSYIERDTVLTDLGDPVYLEIELDEF
jgi:hypothetical protein